MKKRYERMICPHCGEAYLVISGAKHICKGKPVKRDVNEDKKRSKGLKDG